MKKDVKLPENEIQKQYEYMQKVASLTDKKRKVFIQTFGCQQNEADSEKLLGMAIKMGQADRGDGGGCHYDEWKGNWINGVCIENTTFENCEMASIYFFMHQGNTILRNNTEDGGEVKYKIFKDCNGPVFFK